MSSKETSPSDRERKEQEIERKGAVLVLIYVDPKNNDSTVYVLEHNANPKKGIRKGDIGLPCETPDPNEVLSETVNRLSIEEIGIQLKDISVSPQKEHKYLKIDDRNHRIQADIVVIRVSNMEQLQNTQPIDTDEVRRGFFLSLNQLLEDPNIQLRQDLNPRWFLEPLVQKKLL